MKKPLNRLIFSILISIAILISAYYVFKALGNLKSPASISMLVDSDPKTKFFELEQATRSLYPIRLGNLAEEKYAYFSVEFDFIGGNPNKIEGLFQSSPGNLGIRIEHVNKSLILVYSDQIKKEKYRVLVLSDDLNMGELHHIKIEAYARNFVVINFDGNITQILSPNISFAVSDFLLGGNFDAFRVYSGVLKNISFKKVEFKNYLVKALRYFSAEQYPIGPISFLNFMAMGGLYLAIIIFLIIRKFPVPFFNKRRGNYLLIGLLTIIQIILINIYDPYRYIFLVYIFLFIVGFIPNLYIFPQYLNFRRYQWLFAPITGLMILAIFGSYLIRFGIPMQYLLILPVFTFILMGSSLFFLNIQFINFNKLRIEWPTKIEIALIYQTFLIFPIVIILTYVAVTADGVTTPLRIGPDAALYVKMAQYLLDGGTWAQANLRASEFSNMSVGEITRLTNATMDWPFLYFYRWGLSSYHCLSTILNGLDHAYRLAFISIILPVMFCAGTIFYWLRERFKLSLIISIAGCIGFIFNANLLNLWFEGFYGNIFSLCLYAILFLLIDSFQTLATNEVKERVKYIILCALIFTAILLTYGEGLIFVGMPLMAIYILVGLMAGRRLEIRLFQYLIISLLIAVVIVFPCQFIVNWALITIKQVTQEGGNGYAQPYWAYFNDIVGLNNIYESLTNQNAGKELLRSKINFIMAFVSSFLLLVPVIWFAFKSKIKNLLCISAYILIVLFFNYFIYSSPLNNYGYMKAYIFLLPILYVYFWASLCIYASTFKSFFNKNNYASCLMLSVSCAMIISGVSYIVKYNNSSTKISTSFIYDSKYFKGVDFDGAVLYPIFKEKFPQTLSAIIPGTWISEAWNDSLISNNSYLKSFSNRKIYLVGVKDCASKGLPIAYLLKEGRILFVKDSKLSVKDLMLNGKFDLKRIQREDFRINDCN